MRIGVAEQFIGPFRRCIERDWRIGTVGHPKRRVGAHAINRRRRRINQMRDLSVTRELENVDVYRDIRLDIGGGVFERIAYTRVGTEMDDSVAYVVGMYVGESVASTDIEVENGARHTVDCHQT